MDLMSYLFVNFVTFLVFTKRKCHICDIIVLNKLTLTQLNGIVSQNPSNRPDQTIGFILL